MKIGFWVYIQNGGGGSAFVRFFNSEAEAEAYAELDDERYCDDICYEAIEVDENGKILNPSKAEERWDHHG
jgi:hypothetical protein